jgi:hypothetical protein
VEPEPAAEGLHLAVLGFGPGFTVPGRVFHPLCLHRAHAAGGFRPKDCHLCPHRSHLHRSSRTARRTTVALMEGA